MKRSKNKEFYEKSQIIIEKLSQLDKEAKENSNTPTEKKMIVMYEGFKFL